MKLFYKRSLFLIGVLIIGIALIGIGYLFYDKVIHPETEVVVSNELSINYLDGSHVISNGIYRFSVTNDGGSDIYYRISLSDIKGMDEDVTYLLSSSDIDVGSNEKHLVKEQNIVYDNLLISKGDTQSFNLKISNNTSTTFKIVIDKIEDIEEYFYMTLLKNNEVSLSKTNVGEDIAQENEGLISSVDDDGTTYYFRGKVDNNYVSFANLTWRIIRINGDGSVRLILDGVSDTLANYHDNNELESLDKTTLSTSLNNYYDSNLKDYEDSIANTKFCSETSKSENTYNAYTRIVTNKIPTFNCLGKRYTSKIGIITADEVIFAGGLYNKENKDYYLYNEDLENLWWTSSLSKSDGDAIYPFIVDTSGKLVDNVNGSLYRTIRPVISLKREVMVVGSGTIQDPYVVN